MVRDEGADAPEAYLLRINPKVTAWFIADGARELHALEQETGKWFHFEGSEGLPLDHFAVTMEGTRAEIEERAVPFRAGEEVHVDLVEPHMYNEDDAVAKIDGYLIDVVNGVAFVGEKKLVRIEEAGRTTARAVLVGADAEQAEEAARDRVVAREKARAAAKRSAAAKKGAARRREREQEAAVATAKPASRRGAKAAETDGRPDAAKSSRRRRKKAADGDPEAVVDSPPAVEAGEPAGGATVTGLTGAGAEPDAEKPAGRRRSRAKASSDDGAAPAKPAGRKRKRGEEPEEPVAEEPTEAPDEDGTLSSKPRRRGRRGGRRRSRAKADAEVTE
jgi:ribonuclease G